MSAREPAAIRSFMGGLVDYAGLFPPASLDMAAAVAEYAAHLEEKEAWMLGRFIVPAGRLEELGDTCAPHLNQGREWRFSVLVGGRDGVDEALAAAETQGRAVAAFEARFGGRARVEVLEAPLPVEGSGPDTANFLSAYVEAFAAAGLDGRELYLEILPGVDDTRVLEAINALAAFEKRFSRLGAKLRCGGVVPEAFPGCERIAAFIDTCRRLGLPLKCTAGLHHPVRHQAVQPPVMMHGFLNVFGAGILAHAAAVDREVLTACVAETDPEAFTFSAEGFTWREHFVAVADLDRARAGFLAGFGSCSFAEPREDLRTLGIL
ncbi:MAG: hypothetical protein ABFS42_12900 [Candidatus Krumholzibacteriota bacterium]